MDYKNGRVRVFLHVPSHILRDTIPGFMTRDKLLDEIERVIAKINDDLLHKCGYEDVITSYFDPWVSDWNKEWRKKAEQAHIHIYYMPQHMSNIGRGYHVMYHKYRRTSIHRIIYRRLSDNKLHYYSINGSSIHDQTEYVECGKFRWGPLILGNFLVPNYSSKSDAKGDLLSTDGICTDRFEGYVTVVPTY